IDLVYFARVDRRRIEPAGDDEFGPTAWEWHTPDGLRTGDLDADTVKIGCEAIATVENTT
ncbi:NUDIX hydrolase, partial [Halobacteriales archaeon SW_12_67_38]